MKKAITTPYQGPRSKIMSEKNRGQKSRVSVSLSHQKLQRCELSGQKITITGGLLSTTAASSYAGNILDVAFRFLFSSSALFFTPDIPTGETLILTSFYSVVVACSAFGCSYTLGGSTLFSGSFLSIKYR